MWVCGRGLCEAHHFLPVFTSDAGLPVKGKQMEGQTPNCHINQNVTRNWVFKGPKCLDRKENTTFVFHPWVTPEVFLGNLEVFGFSECEVSSHWASLCCTSPSRVALRKSFRKIRRWAEWPLLFRLSYVSFKSTVSWLSTWC